MMQIPEMITAVGVLALAEKVMQEQNSPQWKERASYVACASAAFVCAALSSALGIAAAASFVAIPTAAKWISCRKETGSSLHKAALATGHIIRLAARITTIAWVSIATVSLTSLPGMALCGFLAIHLSVEFIKDQYGTFTTGLTNDHFWEYWSAMTRN